MIGRKRVPSVFAHTTIESTGWPNLAAGFKSTRGQGASADQRRHHEGNDRNPLRGLSAHRALGVAYSCICQAFQPSVPGARLEDTRGS